MDEVGAAAVDTFEPFPGVLTALLDAIRFRVVALTLGADVGVILIAEAIFVRAADGRELLLA